MKNYIKYTLFIFGFLFFFSSDLFASHASGGYIVYDCLGNNSYKVKVIWFSDCNGAAEPELEYDLWYKSNTCNFADHISISKVSDNELYSCPNIETTCNGGDAAGYRVVRYEGIITLPQQCTDWVIYTEISQRNEVDFVEGDWMRLEAGIDNTIGCYSSIDVSDSGIIMGCLNSEVEYSPTIVNPNSYNLTFELICPMDQYGSPVQYSSGLSCLSPYPNNNDFVFDVSTGEISFSSNTTGVSYTAYKINMYNSNGDLIGYTIRDIQIFIDPNCSNNGPQFFGFLEEGVVPPIYSTTISQGEQQCLTVGVQAVSDDGVISDVSVDLSQLPNGGSSISNYGDYAVIEVCLWDDSHDCFEQTYTFTVTATENGCPTNNTKSKTYTINVEEGVFCQANLYYSNRNTQAGSLIPEFSRASEEIWVGDNMPMGYNGPQGPVEIHYPVTFEAGVGINIPSCTGGGYSCIDFVGTSQGDIHFYIKPNNCNPNCNNTPMEISIDEVFECYDERLEANVEFGTPPYTYNWFRLDVNGDPYPGASNYLGSGQVLTIHDEVYEISCGIPTYSDGKFYYKLVVTDASGLEEYVIGEVLGTRNFYINGPGVNNPPPLIPQFMSFPQTVDSQTYVQFQDRANETWQGYACGPPYYGATKYYLRIHERWQFNDVRIDETVDLEGGTRWSFDNGEMYWNGYTNNQVGGLCDLADGLFAYRFELYNCVSDYEEEGAIYVEDCFDGNIPIDPAGMILSDDLQENDEGKYHLETEKLEELYDVQYQEVSNFVDLVDVYVYPNPSVDGLFNLVYEGDLSSIQVFNSNGELIISDNYSKSRIVDISQNSSGIYYLVVQSNYGQKIIKLIKQ